LTKEILLEKLTTLIEEVQSSMGPVTDIWLPFSMMEQLDGRDVLERLAAPFFIGSTIVTVSMSDLGENSIRVAFIKEFKVE